MKVTQLAKKIADTSGSLPTCDLPSATYRFRGTGRYFSGSVKEGIEFHEAFAAFSAGQWVNPKHYQACETVVDALRDLEVINIETEVPLFGSHLSGVADIIGRTTDGRMLIADLKTTLGDYALAPRPAELIQLAAYAALLGQERLRLVCIRLALRHQCINVFEIEQKQILNLMNLVQSVVSKAAA